jgi:NADH oxidase (H2O2-forming)
MKVKVKTGSGPTRASYYPEKKMMHIKLLSHDGKLVGAQLVSEEDVKERVNALTLAILNEMSLHDILYSERCFTPPLSMLVDPLIRTIESS